MVTGRAFTVPHASLAFLSLVKPRSLTISLSLFLFHVSLYFLAHLYFSTSLYSPLNYFPVFFKRLDESRGGGFPEDEWSADVGGECLPNKHFTCMDACAREHIHTPQPDPQTHTHTHTHLGKPSCCVGQKCNSSRGLNSSPAKVCMNAVTAGQQ